MKKELKVGNLVRLLTIEGKELPTFLGLVLKVNPLGDARVHWMCGGFLCGPGHYWEPYRLRVLSA